MSTAILPNEGKAYLLGKCEPSALRLKLYLDNITIDEDTVFADLATEASFPGYAAGTFTWGSITVDGTPLLAHNVSTTVTFTRNSSSGSAQTVKVWAIVDPGASKIVFARNCGDQVFAANGDNYSVTPTAYLGDL